MSVILIKVDAVDITDDVKIAGASFASLVNGVTGEAKFQVKDAAQTYQFNSGDSLTLDVDGVRVWGGYVIAAKKIYALPVIDSSSPGVVTRMWDVVGADYNILFNERIVFKESDPVGKLSFSYDADTYDNTIINDIFDNYLDIATDGLTRTGVTQIAKAILDIPGKIHSGLVASAGFTWKQMMDSVQRATGGVYYISPTKVLTYVDAETTTAAYGLSDQPDGINDTGYQSFTILEDGTKLVNDMFVWGAGNGSPNYVLSRTEDAASIALHGRWQLGLVTSALYRQASVDIVADSYVYGTPQSHRGGKDDAVTFMARVFEPFFLAGDIVDLTCGIFGYVDTLPLRRMTTTFASPIEPIFDLILSHDIDQPVSIAEFAPWPGIDGPPPPPPPPPPECVCGITDPFTRTVASGWGTSDAGIDWVTAVGLDCLASVDGTRAVSFMTADGTGILTADLSWATTGADAFLFAGIQFQVSADPTLHGYTLNLEPDTAHSDYKVVLGYFDYGDGPVQQWFLYDAAGVHDIGQPPPFNIFSPFNIRMESSATYFRVKGWASSSAEPGAWSWESSNPDSTYVGGDLEWFARNFDSGGTEFTLYLDSLDITGVNRCSAVQFDDFNRTVASGWGTATPSGLVWDNSPFGTNNGLKSVNGQQGVLDTGVADYYCEVAITLPIQPPIDIRILGVYFDEVESTSDAINNDRLRIFWRSTSYGDMPAGIKRSGPVSLGNASVNLGALVGGNSANLRLVFTPTTGTEYSAVGYAWATGSTEPTTPNLVPTYGGLVALERLYLTLLAGDTRARCYLNAIGDFSCLDVTAPLVLGPAPTYGAWGCETAKHLASDTYQLSFPYIPGTTSVHLNGRLMRLTYDYTEDFQQAQITFVMSVNANDVVYVCYRAIGPGDSGV